MGVSMYKKTLTILALILLASSCTLNKIHVYKNPILYNKQLKESIDNKKFKETKYILKQEPNYKTLDYYKYLVKYYYLTNNLKELMELNKKEKNLFVKSYLDGLIFTAKGIYYFDDALKKFYEAEKYQELYNQPISELFYNIAVIEIKKEHYKISINYIEKALKKDFNEKYLVLKAYILMKQGKYKTVQKLLNNSFEKINKEKNLIKALNIMSFTFDSLRPMPKELKAAYARWLAVVQTAKHLQTVLKVAKEGMQEYPEYSEMYTLAGLASYLLDNKSEAVSYFTKAMQMDKKRPFNFVQMGIIYWNLKQYIKAEDYFLKAIAMNKYSPIVYAYLSKLAKQSQSIRTAIKYKELQRKFGTNFDTEMELVTLYKLGKKPADTKKLLEAIIKKYPNRKDSYKEMVHVYDDLIEEESNPDIKLLLRKKQLVYEKLYKQKDEEESKRKLVKAEIESNDQKKK